MFIFEKSLESLTIFVFKLDDDKLELLFLISQSINIQGYHISLKLKLFLQKSLSFIEDFFLSFSSDKKYFIFIVAVRSLYLFCNNFK